MSVRLTMVMAGLFLYLGAETAAARGYPEGAPQGYPPGDPQGYQWDLEALYDGPEPWNAALLALVERSDALEACAGQLTPLLTQGPEKLADCLKIRIEAAGLALRTRTWAELQVFDGLLGIERVENWNRTMAPHRGVFDRFDAAAARVDPVAVDSLPEADVYRDWLDGLRRNVAHVPVQQAAAQAVADTARPFNAVYGAITGEPLAWPGVTLSDGRFARVDPLSYPHLLWRPDPDDRHRANELYWAAWDLSLHALAANLDGRVQADARIARAQAFSSVLDAELFRAGLPGDTLSRVRDLTNQAGDTLGTWFRLRGYVLGTGKLSAADMHVPLGPVPGYTLAEARGILVEALAPLHGRAAQLIDQGFDNGWLQLTPGHEAFVAHAGPGTHPYIGIDYLGDVLSLLELARVWGIALHMHFSDRAQPPALAATWPLLNDTFGTASELLIVDYLSRGSQTNEQKLAWLSIAQDLWYRRFFRPAALADFERSLREWAAAEDPFRVLRLDELFSQTLARIHSGAVRDEAAFRSGWAAESGLYHPYAGLRQAVATAAAAQLVDGLLRKGGSEPTAFRRLLAAGRSQSPALLLSANGVDLAGHEAFQRVLTASGTAMDQLLELVPGFVTDPDREKREQAARKIQQDPIEGRQPNADESGD